MIRMPLEDMLGELGYTVAAEAAGIEEALEATKNADFDLGILDADLNGQPRLAGCPSPRYPRHTLRPFPTWIGQSKCCRARSGSG